MHFPAKLLDLFQHELILQTPKIFDVIKLYKTVPHTFSLKYHKAGLITYISVYGMTLGL